MGPDPNLETVYEKLAASLDDVGDDKRDVFLAKLVLLLARDLNDVERICAHIAAAAENLDI